MKKILRLLIRYLSSSFIATLVHLVVFASLLRYCGPMFSTLVGGFTGALLAYGLSRRWVFAQRNCNKQRFAITAASQIAVNTLVVTLMTQWGAPPYFAQLTAMAVVTVQGFTINNFWVFKDDVNRETFQ